MIIFEEIEISPLLKAIKSLEEGLLVADPNELERDGVIQRFEYTFELSWKIIRKCFTAMGRIDISSSPKPILREAIKEGFIDDLEKWFSFLEARNLTAHTYNENQAKLVYNKSKNFLICVKNLVEKLEEKGK